MGIAAPCAERRSSAPCDTFNLFKKESRMSRIGIFAYGVLSYAVFFAVFLYGIGFIAGFLTPTSLDGVPMSTLGHALTVDLSLLAAFAIQHSGMARPGFKAWWKRIVPEAAERSTYVLLSSLALAALYVCWEPIDGVVWRVPEGIARNSVVGVDPSGWR